MALPNFLKKYPLWNLRIEIQVQMKVMLPNDREKETLVSCHTFKEQLDLQKSTVGAFQSMEWSFPPAHVCISS